MKPLVETVLLMGLSSCVCFGQSVPGGPEFEVVSIKPAGWVGAGFQVSYDPGRLTVRNASLKSLIELAYRVKDYQISGGPKWLDSARYDIEAKLPAGSAAGSHRPMLQTLLSERFQLKLHTETKPLGIYALRVARNGPRLQAARGEHGDTSVGQRRIAAKGISMVEVAEALSNVLDRPVEDKTGIAGRFDIQLQWSPDEREPGTLKPGTTAPSEDSARPSASDAAGPGIFAALEGQLGLKLEAAKAPVEIQVIDHAEKPSGN
jgi:uncharacterized protein (TIGR03435 family)